MPLVHMNVLTISYGGVVGKNLPVKLFYVNWGGCLMAWPYVLGLNLGEIWETQDVEWIQGVWLVTGYWIHSDQA